MSLLDKVSEWIERKLIKAGLIKDKKEEERYAKYPNVDREIQKEIYNSTFNYEIDPYVDVVVNDVIKFKNKMTKFTYEFCSVEIEFENGTKVQLWTENCWYGFLSTIELIDKYGNEKKFKSKRPSEETIISFLNAYHEYFSIEDHKVQPRKSHIDKYYTQNFFNFDSEEKEEKDESEKQP